MVVLQFPPRGRHARASAGSGAGICAKTSKVMSGQPCSVASLTSAGQRPGGMPRVRQPLTTLAGVSKAEATLPVPPSSSITEPAVRIAGTIVRTLRTCQQFATGETTFPAECGPIRAVIDPPEIIGPRLKALREALGFKTQTKFAEQLGYTKTTYNPWEKGTRPLTFEAACVIRKHYGVPLDWMFFGADAERLPAGVHKRLGKAA